MSEHETLAALNGLIQRLVKQLAASTTRDRENFAEALRALRQAEAWLKALHDDDSEQRGVIQR